MRTLLVLALALGLPACAHSHARGSAPPTVRTSGEGRVATTPDLATVVLGVDVVAGSVADAARDADARGRAIVAALRGAGVAEKDVRTTRYDVAPERRYEQNQPPKTVGWRVTHELRVAIRGGDAARVGPVLDAALRAGANVAHSIAFEREDPGPERARALEQAVAAARVKAEALARAAGRTLGPARLVAESAGGPPVPLTRMALGAAKQEGAPVQAGDLEVTGQVEVEFELR